MFKALLYVFVLKSILILEVCAFKVFVLQIAISNMYPAVSVLEKPFAQALVLTSSTNRHAEKLVLGRG